MEDGFVLQKVKHCISRNVYLEIFFAADQNSADLLDLEPCELLGPMV